MACPLKSSREGGAERIRRTGSGGKAVTRRHPDISNPATQHHTVHPTSLAVAVKRQTKRASRVRPCRIGSTGGSPLTLAELLPALHGLAKSEKLLAIQVLAADVARDDGEVLPPSEAAYPVWSPYDAFEGAATLMRLLEEEKAA